MSVPMTVAMTTMARAFFFARRRVSDAWGVAIAIGFAVLLGAGMLTTATVWDGNLLVLTALGVYAVAVGRAVVREVTPSAGARAQRATAATRELEMGLLLLVGAYVIVSVTGGLRSHFYPLVYALVSFLLIVRRRAWVAWAWIGAAFALELALGWRAGFPGVVGLHMTYIGFFALGNLLVLSSLAQRLRANHGRAMQAEIARVRQEARDFRLIASALPLSSRADRERADEELRLAHGAVHAVHEQLYFTIDLLCNAMGLHTCALLWVRDGQTDDPRGTPALTIKEMATASELVREHPDLDGPGILAGALRSSSPVVLKSLGGRRLPPYYAGPEPVTDLIAVPLRDGEVVRGLLCADRVDDRPFDDNDLAALQKSADQVLRIIEQERSFAAVERGKYEQEQFYAASELLNQALTVEDVYDRTFAALARMAAWDIAVITSYDAHARRHEVLATRLGESAAEDRAWAKLDARLQGLSFEDDGGLASIAVKNRHHVPVAGEFPDPDAVVFDRGSTLKKARSVLVLPLLRGDQVLGTLTLATHRERAYREQTREMLRVIGHQVAVSLQNARMYQSMEQRATTDGLTGLLNHRAFQERLEQLHDLAERGGRTYSVILTDIDHFKGVNDTYGHPAGDDVLRRVSALFDRSARKVDIVARYGGEEFVLILPDTDGEGAALFANRLREDVSAQTMTSEHGSFGCTISMGIAEFPRDGGERAELIRYADQALYYSKEHGRDRVTRFAEM